MSSVDWRYDHASRQRVRWSKSEKCYVNEARKKVKNPQFNAPSGPVASSSRTAANPPRTSGDDVSSIERGMQEINVHASQPAQPSAGTPSELNSAAQLPDHPQPTWDAKRIRELEGKRDPQIVTGYIVSRKPTDDYRRGRVIEVLLVPPCSSATSSYSRITPNDQVVLPTTSVRLRRFVVVSEPTEARTTFDAIAIKTYNGQGVGATGVIKSHHSIIHTGACPNLHPAELPTRLPNGHFDNGVQVGAIKVLQYDLQTALDPMARLDYSDRYEFDYGVPNIRLFGRVQEASLALLFVQYHAVYSLMMRAAQGAVPRPNTHPTTDTRSTTTEVPSRRVDYSTADSGPITAEQMRHLLQDYRAYAERNGYSMPEQQLTAQQIQGLAADSVRRAAYLRRIRDLWQDDEADESDASS